MNEAEFGFLSRGSRGLESASSALTRLRLKVGGRPRGSSTPRHFRTSAALVLVSPRARIVLPFAVRRAPARGPLSPAAPLATDRTGVTRRQQSRAEDRRLRVCRRGNVDPP
ncbi:hypothetical protein AOLI_G00302600 [Acnodon oligacanthus]